MHPEIIDFDNLPPLLEDDVVTWPSGKVLAVVVHVPIHLGDGAPGVLYKAEWKHDDFIAMAPGEESDAVARGGIKFERDNDFQSARILFSRKHQTAALRGPSLVGEIKAAPQR
ncbi:TPA: hypothetical protein ACGY71_001350 [Stenotrophomonas maltophilia]